MGHPVGAVDIKICKGRPLSPNSDPKIAFDKKLSWLGVFFLSPYKYYAKNCAFQINNLFACNKIVSKITKKFKLKLTVNRNFAPSTYPYFKNVLTKYEGISAIELPAWAVIAINSEQWKKMSQTRICFSFMVPRCGDAVHDKKHLCLCRY